MSQLSKETSTCSCGSTKPNSEASTLPSAVFVIPIMLPTLVGFWAIADARETAPRASEQCHKLGVITAPAASRGVRSSDWLNCLLRCPDPGARARGGL